MPGPGVDPERARAVSPADLPQLVRREDPARAALAPGDPLELAQLLERVDPHVRVRADAERDPAMVHANRREEAVAEVGLGRRAGADRRACVAKQVELGAVRVRRMHDGRPLAEAAAVGEQLDRAQAVLGEALLDLARLLVGVDVEHEPFPCRVAADLLEPVARAGADGVGGDADRETRAPEPFDLGEVRGHGRLSHALETTARVRDVEADEARSPPRRQPRPRRTRVSTPR